jgi:hypothetical protein
LLLILKVELEKLCFDRHIQQEWIIQIVEYFGIKLLTASLQKLLTLQQKINLSEVDGWGKG